MVKSDVLDILPCNVESTVIYCSFPIGFYKCIDSRIQVCMKTLIRMNISEVLFYCFVRIPLVSIIVIPGGS